MFSINYQIKEFRKKIPESNCSVNTLFFLKSEDKIVDAKELEGENGGVIVETLDSGEILQSMAAFETSKVKLKSIRRFEKKRTFSCYQNFYQQRLIAVLT